jgi:hypothetical protein
MCVFVFVCTQGVSEICVISYRVVSMVKNKQRNSIQALVCICFHTDLEGVDFSAN